jgi:hypothetical protein
MEEHKLAVLDFDGTLLNGDSVKIFCRFCSDSVFQFYVFYYGYCKVLSRIKGKNTKHFTVDFFKRNKTKFDREGFNLALRNKLFPDSVQLINDLKTDYRVVIVSASFREIILDFVDYTFEVPLLSNSIDDYQLDINHDRKVHEIYQHFPNAVIHIAYGNSKGDYAMLTAAIKSYYRYRNGVLMVWKG